MHISDWHDAADPMALLGTKHAAPSSMLQRKQAHHVCICALHVANHHQTQQFPAHRATLCTSTASARIVLGSFCFAKWYGTLSSALCQSPMPMLPLPIVPAIVSDISSGAGAASQYLCPGPNNCKACTLRYVYHFSTTMLWFQVQLQCTSWEASSLVMMQAVSRVRLPEVISLVGWTKPVIIFSF